MKTKILSYLMVLLGVVGLTACDSSIEPNPKSQGQVDLSKVGVEVDNAELVVKRATYDCSGFLITILNESGAICGSWVYSEMPEIVTLEVGKYTLEAKSHVLERQAWDMPYFYGSTTFEVKNGEITSVDNVVCKFESLKVTIKYTDRLLGYLNGDAKVTVVANDEGLLEYSQTETRSGYFAVVDGSNTLVAQFEGTVNGNVETLRKTYTDVKSGTHLILTFDVKAGDPTIPDEFGQIASGGIGIDVSVDSEDLTGDVTTDEDAVSKPTRPGDDFGQGEDPGPDKPTPPGPGDDPQNTITIKSDDVLFNEDEDYKEPNTPGDGSYVVKIHTDAEKGLAHLNVEIKSDNDNFKASVLDLMPLSFDLAEAGENSEAFSSIGFPVNEEVRGASDVDFVITEFVPLLTAFQGTHQFIITVVDKAADDTTHTLTRTLTFVVQ